MPDTDLEIGGGGGGEGEARSSRLLERGGGLHFFVRPFGPQFGLDPPL